MSTSLPTFRRAFLTGLLVLAPLGVTAWVSIWLFRLIDDLVRPMILSVPGVANYLPPGGIQGIGVVAAVLVVTIVGFFANNLLGRTFFGLIDSLLARIPWVKGVYGAAKEISGVVFSENRNAFQRVVAIEYPRPGSYSVGFVTESGEDPGGARFVHVFLPTSPNPTSGYFLLLQEEDTRELALSVEEGLKLIVSGGSVIAPARRADLYEQLVSLEQGGER